MPALVLGDVAKALAKTYFRGLNLTLAGIPSTANPGTGTGSFGIQRQGTTTAVMGAGPTIQVAANKVPAVNLGSRIGVANPAPQQAPATGTPMAVPPGLFRAASNSAADVDNQRQMHDMYNWLFDSLIDAIGQAFEDFRRTAGLVDVKINAAIATGGKLTGPSFEMCLLRAPAVSGWTGWNAGVRDALARGLHNQWHTLCNSVRVPALPWYPTFFAWPSPIAPPTPNVPTPFALLVHDINATSPKHVRDAALAKLRVQMEHAGPFFESLGFAFHAQLQLWKTSQLVSNVFGLGSVPTYAPPYVPTGPVVDGRILPGPHLMV